MNRDRGPLYAALASTVLSVLLATAVNVGTGGALPGPLAALVPFAWPLVAVLTVLTVWLAVRAGRPDPAPAPAAGDVPVRPAELPAADGWTGRGADLERLHALVAAGRRAVVVAGPPGVGKSALAVRLAHDLAAAYPDGQLVAALGAGGGAPADPVAVLGDLLDRLGAAVPATTDADRLAARWRSVTADRRLIVVLDDARDATQVRPLLPGATGCLTLITSRSSLAGLSGSVTYDLGVLTPDDAVAVLRETGGGDRVDAEPAAAAEVVAACGALPLAVALAGARLRRRPAWRVADLAARLRDERSRLDVLHAGDTGVRAGFASAYDDLPAADRRAFRALGAYPGRDLPAGAAAALTGDPGAAERLADARLVEAVAADRYRLHDLLRLYARERLAAEDPPGTGDAAFDRLAGWYAARFADGDADWIDAEVANVALAVRAALDRGAAAAAHRLAVAADVPLLHRTEHYVFLGICRDRLAAAEALGDARARDEALTRLGETANAYGLVDEGVDRLRAAAARWADRDDPGWRAHTRKSLGVALRDAGRYAEAVPELEAALVHFRAVGDRRRAAQTLTDLGVVLVVRGEPDRALAVLDEARALAAAATDMHPQERVWPLLPYATALHQQGRYAEARPLLEEAARGFADPPNRVGQGLTLLELAVAADAAGDPATADRHVRAAREAFARVDHRPGLAMAAQAVGDGHARHGRHADAEAAYRAAADAYQELGNRPNAGLALLCRAEQLLALGRPADAEAARERGEMLLDGSDLPQADRVRARLPDRPAG
jgi:tetratricopeptide (TPR) repeat protein